MQDSSGECSRSVRRAVRIGGAAVLITPTVLVTVTEPWHAERPQRFAVLSAILLVVLVAQLVAMLAVTSRRARLVDTTVLGAALSAIAVTTLWILPGLSAPGLPEQPGLALVAVEAGAVFAALLAVVRTRDVRQAVLAALWAGALSTYLLVIGALLAFAFVPASVPNTQGRAMSLSATAAERLAANRVEAPDGYLSLLVLALVLSILASLAVPMTRSVLITRPAPRVG
jgi:hypothetical protein